MLHNLVTDQDLATEQDHAGLVDEVRHECAKYGSLISMYVPRHVGDKVAESALRKVFLEYATVQDAEAASRELAGRQFGPNVVQVRYLRECEQCL